MELKDKMGGEIPGGGGFSPSAGPVRADNKLAEAAAALSVLGYSGSEISTALKGIDPQELPVEDIVRTALKKMM